MSVDPRMHVRAAAVPVCALFVVTAVACGGAPPRQEAAGTAPAAATVLSAAERAAWYQACWGHFNAKAWDGFRACYADSVESEQVGGGQPHAGGSMPWKPTRRRSRPPFPT